MLRRTHESTDGSLVLPLCQPHVSTATGQHQTIQLGHGPPTRTPTPTAQVDSTRTVPDVLLEDTRYWASGSGSKARRCRR